MKYLFDTDICVYWLNGNQSIEQRAMQVGLYHIAISFITLSELYYETYKSRKIKQNLDALKSLKSKLSIVDSDMEISLMMPIYLLLAVQ